MGKKPPKPSARVRRAAETNDAVERILESSNRLWAALTPEQIPGAQENVRRLRRGEAAWWPPAVKRQLGGHLVTLMDFIARRAVVDLWRQQGRVAYDLNPEMAAHLYRADLRGKLPGGLFRRLPHISPMVPLPRPWPFRANDGTEGLIRAYFLTGHVGQAFCPTTDPRSQGLLVMPWIEWSHAVEGEYEAVATPLFALPDTEEPFTLDDVIDRTNAWAGTASDGTEKRMVRQILPGLMSVLMYLCCDNRDVQEPVSRGPGASKRRKAAPPRDPFWVQVGWRIGPKLHATRMLAQGGGRIRDGVSVPSGVEYGPQHRVGHYKWVRHGPGRSQQSFKFIEPYWTKRELMEQMWAEGREIGTGIIPVDQQRGDPSGHRDVRRSNLGRAKAKEIREREAQRAREDGWEF